MTAPRLLPSFWHRSLALLSLLTVFLPSGLRGQHYFFEKYGAEQGINSRVNTIVQDKKDYCIWLGTKSGLTKFTGNSTEVYTSEHGLAPGAVKVMIMDAHNRLWLGHLDGGLTLYDGRKFHRLNGTKFDNKSDITALLEDINGDIWVTTISNGAFRIRKPGSEIHQLDFEHFKGGDFSDIVIGVNLAFHQRLFFITEVGIKEFVRDSAVFRNYLPAGLFSYFAKTAIHQDHHGNVWFGLNNGGITVLDSKTNTFTDYDIKSGLAANMIYCIFEDSRGTIWTSNPDWYGLGGGISRFEGDKFTPFTKKNGLQDDKIQCIAEDMEGNILIGTNENGLLVFKGEQFLIFSEQNFQENRPGLINGQVYAILESTDGKIWFGTDGGISIYNPADNTFENHTPTNSMLHNRIRFLCEDVQKNVWIGTDGGGIFRYLRASRRFVQEYDLNNFFLDQVNTVRYMISDSKGRVWIGSNKCLGWADVRQSTKGYFTQGDGISGNTITAIFADSHGNIWQGAQGKGMAILSVAGKKFSLLDTLKGITPKSFVEDKSGNIWVGTESEGIYLLSPSRKVIRHLTVRDGLLENTINFLQNDHEGNIYIGTLKGLQKYLATKDRLITYTKRNGYVGIESKDHASYLDHQGYLWFGTANGAVRYNPSVKENTDKQPLVRIVRMQVDFENRAMKPGLKLGFKQNTISFEYLCVSLTNPDALRYQVKLEGLEEEWQQPTQQGNVTYYNIPPGKYTFHVKARNAYGVWNDPPLSYSFTIKPPFYRQWWFVLLALVSGIGGVWLYIMMRERNLRNEKKVLEEKVEERTHELRYAYDEIALKNKDITDSIRYAQRIQFAILPPKIIFDETFVLFRPKDIVSGDFYWMITLGEREYMAAIDCTGHGVPGAFMSFIGYSSLNKIVREHNITTPNEILRHLNTEVNTALHRQTDETMSDGMDLSLVCYHRPTCRLEFAGAYNSICIVRNGELTEYKADRYPIGFATASDKMFTNLELVVEPGDMLYMYTDGYADQFGGPEGKKFRSKPMKALLAEIAHHPAKEQKELLDRHILNWKGDYDQIDDILVMGRRF